MAYLTTILIEHDPRVARGISRAIEARGFPRPMQITAGQVGLEWISHNECDLCLLDYDLPDLNAIDFVVKIHQRKADLPIVLLSGARSESVAVAAFRAGVADYIPKDAGLYEAVVRAVHRMSEARAVSQTPAVVPTVPEGIPVELLNPTYQNRLRVIGRQIDLHGYRMAAIVEVEGGFLMRALPARDRTPEALEFPDRDFLHWITESFRVRGEGERSASTSKLLPSGYEDFLRAVGAALDRQKAEAISVVEYASVIVVGGTVQNDNSAQVTVGNLQWILHQEEINQILDEGYRRRSAPQKRPAHGSVLDRIFGHQRSLQRSPA